MGFKFDPFYRLFLKGWDYLLQGLASANRQSGPSPTQITKL